MTGIDRTHLAALHAREEARFADTHPRSAALAVEARDALLGGVPMNWMARWPGRFPVFADRATGSHITDVDGTPTWTCASATPAR